MLYRSAVAVAAAVCCLLPAVAYPCGGCFSPAEATTEQTVLQNSERVLFWRNETTKKSYAWIEVVYGGLAKDFGWVLPLPKLPKVSVGSKLGFDALDRKLAYRVAVTQTAVENCRDPYGGCVPAESKQSADMSGAASIDIAAGVPYQDVAPPKVEGVEVLDHGSTGPYDYAVIKGADSAALYKWLTLAGYKTPEKAKPILQVHADKGDVFLAIKLQNGQGITAIRPVALEMDDAEPCVPLRLTSIAAQNDMTVAVTVAGPGRAVVKNNFDVTVNPLRLTLLDASKPVECLPGNAGAKCHVPKNYGQVLAAAIDEAAGHAFVTEASVAGSTLAKLSPLQDLDLKPLESAKNMLDFANFVLAANLPVEDEVVASLQPAFMNAGPMFMQATAAEAFGAMKACAKFWQQAGATDACVSGKLTLDKAKLVAAQVTGTEVAKSLKTGIIDPLFVVSDAMGKMPRVTRLVMRISPEEMDRDPVFAFSTVLPEVNPTQLVQQNQVCTEGWSNGDLRTRMTVNAIGSWLIGNDTSIIDPLFIKSTAAMAIAVQEEQGAPIFVDQGDVAVLDAAIAGAKPGVPSIPKGLTLKPFFAAVPPESAKIVTKIGNWIQPPGCTPKPGWVNGKVPPSGQAPDAISSGDAGASDAGGTDLTAALDAGAGTGATTGKAATSGGSGCAAGGAGSPWAASVVLLAAVAVAGRRRIRPEISARAHCAAT